MYSSVFFQIFKKTMPLTMAVRALKGDWETSTMASSLQAFPPLDRVLPPPGQTITQLCPAGPRPSQIGAIFKSPGHQDQPQTQCHWPNEHKPNSSRASSLLPWFASRITIQMTNHLPNPSFCLSIHLTIHMSIHPFIPPFDWPCHGGRARNGSHCFVCGLSTLA